MHPSRLNFSGSSKTGTAVGSYLISAATYEPKRSMSNSRLINTIIILIAAISLCYCSLFYIPSLFHTQMIIGTSTSRDNLETIKIEPDPPWYTPAMNLFHMKKGYFKAGSKIQVAYNSTPGSKVTLLYQQCTGKIVAEIFSCTPGTIYKFKASGHRGMTELPVHRDGFYYFSQSVEYTQDSGDFVILWGR